MSDQVAEVQDDAEAMASAMAGYNKEARTDEVPAQSSEPSEQPYDEAPAESEAIEAEPTEAEKIASTLADLKAQVASIRSQSDPHEVRKLYGEIGNINRTLQQMQTQTKETASQAEVDELSAAMLEAEKVAGEFEELGGPIVRALKAVAARPATSAPEVDIDSVVAERVEAVRKQDALEALAEEHPDWQEKRWSQEFEDWLLTQPQEYQHRLMNSWNPAVVSKGLTSFDEFKKAKEKKQNRLAAAVTPQGVPVAGRSSVIPDEQGFYNGYNRGPKRLNLR